MPKLPEQNQPSKNVDRFIRLCTVCLACCVVLNVLCTTYSHGKGKLKKTWIVKSLRHGVFPGGHPSKY